MKKLLSMLLATTLCLGFTACSGTGSTNGANADNAESTTADAAAQTAQLDGKLVIGLDDEFPPMGFRDDNNEIVGFDIDLAKAAGEKLGCEVEFQPIAWDSKELELESGNIDFIWNGLTITPEREEAMEFTKPYLKNKQVILVKNGSPITKKEDLEGKVVGVQAGSSAKDAVEADEMFSKLSELTEYDTNVLAIADLDIGRVDAVVADEIVARYQLQQGSNDITILENGDFGDEVYGVAAKKGNTELVAKLQGALDELGEDGTAAKISEKWFGEDIYQH
ncbi:MAG TPA: amino acid ABC transporter substrate-binding protein [Lachnospiraceae bacterium]|nr:amino acid ABC transporter substrate-binding protein [Lachnospiraceae bacterium]